MLNSDIKNTGDNSGAIVKENSGNIIVINGIDEKRAREICAETYSVARRDFTIDAYECANARVAKFEEVLMPKIQKVEGALNAFTDPSFQFLLTNAQKTAAATEREPDYDLLAELLISRVTKGKERKVCAGISRAVEIVDKIDDDALCALTTMFVIAKLYPIVGSCTEGIQVLSNIYKKVSFNLPESKGDWFDHLEILDCVRINTFGSLKKLNQYYPEQMNGYFCVGIEKESEQYHKAIELLKTVNLSPAMLIEHELLEGFVRIPVVNRANLSQISLTQIVHVHGVPLPISRNLTTEELEVFNQIFDSYSVQEDKKKIVCDKFFEIWNKDEVLKKVSVWWDNLSKLINLTAVGNVIANANANRLDANVPKLF